MPRLLQLILIAVILLGTARYASRFLLHSFGNGQSSAIAQDEPAPTVTGLPYVLSSTYSKAQGNSNPFFTPASALAKTQLSPAVVDAFWSPGLASSDSPLNANGPVYVVSKTLNSNAPQLTFRTYAPNATNSFSGHHIRVPKWAVNQCGSINAESSGPDCHIIIVDYIEGYEVDGWQCANGGGGGTYNGMLHSGELACTWAGSYPIGSSGLGKNGEGGVHAGFAIGMVDVTPQEILNAERGMPIKHAFMIGTKCLNNPNVYPADDTIGSDAPCNESTPGEFPSYGDLVVLVPNPSVPVSSHSAPCKAILAAMQTYGAYLGDTGGAIQLLSLSDYVYTSDPSKPADPWVRVLNQMIAGGDASGSYNVGGTDSRWSSCLQGLQASDFNMFRIKKP